MLALLKLLWIFMQIGILSFGGGYATIPLIQKLVVEQEAWISMQTYSDIITISQMTPGPLAVNTSTFVGLQIAGLPGAVIATFGCVIGGCLLSIFLLNFFQKHKESTHIKQMFEGLRAGSTGLITGAGMTIVILTLWGATTLDFNILDLNITAFLLFIGALFAIRKYKLDPILTMTICGILGYFIY